MSDREALKSVAVIRDAFESVREQFRDEQYVIDSIIAGLDIAIGIVDTAPNAQGSAFNVDATNTDPDTIVEALNGRDENVGE